MDQKYLSSGFGYNHTKVDEIVARQHRGGHLDNHHKLQSENDYLRERVQACEKGITNIYQVRLQYKFRIALTHVVFFLKMCTILSSFLDKNK